MKKFFEKLGTTEIRNILAVIITLGSFVAVYIMMFKPIPQGNKETVDLVVGMVLGAGIGGVIGYYFGASKKDNEKPTN